ncbi:MAG: efflux RND transporter periplasmic adaptor subunit [Planctomycetaceae bacterium]|nr:efflux RND transporter periplasmic adaptor subunit [Planctomycetaceae bacterium]
MKKRLLYQLIIVVFGLVVIGFVGYQYRHGVELPAVAQWFGVQHEDTDSCTAPDEHAWEGDVHSELGHDHSNDLFLSDQALKNIGVTGETTVTLTLGRFRETTTYPGIVTAKPGRSEVGISAPAAGMITKIYHEPGDLLPPNAPLFDIDLTNEELIKSQTELISLDQKLEIIDAELKRLKSIAEEMPKLYRESTFQKMETETAIANERNKLRLYGLTDEVIEREIRGEKSMIRLLTVHVPDVTETQIVPFHSVVTQNGETLMPHPLSRSLTDKTFSDKSQPPLQLLQLDVERGMRVGSGQTLAKIADYSQLFIKGSAFDFDAGLLSESLKQNSPVTAVFDGHGKKEIVDSLCLRSIDNQIDPGQRTLAFLVGLPNKRLDDNLHDNDSQNSDSQYVHWQFKPGQRCELRVGTESIDDCFVLPAAAVVREAAEACVFKYGGMEDGKKIWTKTPVHVLTQNQESIVIANDGSINAGQKIAGAGAAQMLVALNTGTGKIELTSACSDPTHDHSGHSD